MRIAHTSDWHAGRVFKQVDRLPEMQAVLDSLADELARHRVDLLLHSGDVFDSGAPSPAAEHAVFSFFKRVGRAGIRTVVIAGNHDSADRLAAWGGLAELVDVTVVPRPVPADRGGLVTVRSRDGETALVAAVPFAAPRWFVSALDLAEGRVDAAGQKTGGDVVARQAYAQSMAGVVQHLTGSFRADTVNLAMLHTHLVGASFSGSERTVHLGEEWAAMPQALPATAHYVALGHIHRPQRIESCASPAHYAGSPLQMDFGESGEDKHWVLVDARPGQPAHVEHVPYRHGKRLDRVTATLEVLERDADQLRSADSLLWVTVPLEHPDPELNSRVRRLLPNAVKVEAEVRERPAEPVALPRGTSAPDLFRAWYRSVGREPSPAVVAQFERLLHECESEG